MMRHPYLPLTEPDRISMLQQIGVSTMEDLLTEIPQNLRCKKSLDLSPSQTEVELKQTLSSLAFKNQPLRLSFLGAGAYQHYIPALIDHLANRSEFYTSYTPYQPEISQGVLQAMFEYQTYVSELFGLPIANASMYDGPTALAEAVIMAAKETKRSRILLPYTLHPNLLRVLQTYTANQNLELVTILDSNGLVDSTLLKKELQTDTAAVVIQSPNFFGLIENITELFKITKESGAVPICYVHPLTLGLLEAPGNLGAEMVIGEGQPLGLPLAYGGPYLGLMAVSERFLRRIPGRIVGETIDHNGKRAFVLTLQTREQHIRREKATSNICSNQALCALRASIYLSIMGPEGLREIACRAFNNAHYLAGELKLLGLELLYPQAPFYLEFAVKTPQPAAYYLEMLASKNILAGFDLGRTHPHLKNALLICATEIFSKQDLDYFVTELRCLL